LAIKVDPEIPLPIRPIGRDTYSKDR
jgi:hypothetical protein